MQGNIFAVRPGKKDGPPTYAGSHLDTQVSLHSPMFKFGTYIDAYLANQGHYDGILGVHAGIEALKTMNDNDITTEYPTGT